jgi:hypothetical protein
MPTPFKAPWIPCPALARLYAVGIQASLEGALFNRRSSHAQIRSPNGIVTVQHSMETLWSGAPNTPTSPLTGIFFLLQHDSVPTVQDTLQIGDRMRVRTVTSRSSVRARSRTFYYNGAGPALSLAAGLPDLLEEYWTYRPHKALAVAYDSPSRWTYGYGYGFPTREGAVGRALEECRAAAERRRIDTPCRLIAADEQGVEP